MSGDLLATVVSVGTTGLELRLDGEEIARIKEYKCLASYIPSADDRVLVVPISGTYLVIGRVVDAPITTVSADTAAKLNTSRTIEFTGDVTGAWSFNGDADVSAALDGIFSNRAAHVQNQSNTAETSDIYFRVVSNKLNFRVGTGGTWYVITSA